jgi:hypothetical protein
MDLHTYGMFDVEREEHERTVRRTEQRARLKAYPPPKRAGLLLLRHERTGMWAPCDTTNDFAREARFCWSGSA